MKVRGITSVRISKVAGRDTVSGVKALNMYATPLYRIDACF